jgi:hypothetical protein
MTRRGDTGVKRTLFCLAVLLGLPGARVGAYVDHMSGLTLGYVIEHSPVIVVLAVEKVSPEKRAIVFRKVAHLKGKHPTGRVKHQLREGLHPHELKAVLDWAAPGWVAVCFHDGTSARTCIGRYWYECHATRDGWWKMSHGQGNLCFAYWGSAEKLRGHVAAMVAGREVARKLVTVALLMLKNDEPYRYAKPDTVRAKLNAVRRTAGEAARKKEGRAAASAGSVAGRLNATYRRSALPAAKGPEQWSAGEHRALAAAGVTAFAREVHAEPVKQPRPRPKKAKSKS